MGLHATVEFDFPTETPVLGIPIDYSEALDEFCSVFDDVSTDLCPVDTGYLRSTLSSDHDGELTAECWADAEYAQYQEYGTWCMGAQPYFEPAINDAMGQATPIFQEKLEEALQEEQEELEKMMEDSGGGEMSGGGMGFFGMILMAVVIGLVRGLVEALKTAVSSDDKSHGSSGGMYSIDIT